VLVWEARLAALRNCRPAHTMRCSPTMRGMQCCLYQFTCSSVQCHDVAHGWWDTCSRGGGCDGPVERLGFLAANVAQSGVTHRCIAALRTFQGFCITLPGAYTNPCLCIWSMYAGVYRGSVHGWLVSKHMLPASRLINDSSAQPMYTYNFD
jgi:hypothetical protein